MELKLITPNKTGKNISVSDKIFGGKYKQALVHQVVTACLAAGRAGTKAQKTRAEVSGGGAKPWRQKGTGRARAGTTRSPIWRKGGVTFAARPRDFTQKVNKKMYQAALRSILSGLVSEDRLMVVEELKISSNKTKDFAKKMKELNVDRALIVTEKWDANLHLASRNIAHVQLRSADNINPVDLISFDKVVMTMPVIKHLEEWLG